MKKLFVTLAFLAVSLISNAQFFVAGSVSASHSSSKTVYVNHETDCDPRYNGFSVTPAVGYMIPGKSYGFGLGLGYAYSSGKKDLSKDFTNTFDFGPFFRYAFAKFEKITLYVDAKVPVSVSNANTKIGDEIKDGNKSISIGGRLIPGLTYKFTPHILFTTEIGLLSINYNHKETTSFDGNKTEKVNDFKLGANTRQIASFGFVYLF